MAIFVHVLEVPTGSEPEVGLTLYWIERLRSNKDQNACIDEL